MQLGEGLISVAIDLRATFGFVTALCSVLLNLPLLIIYIHKQNTCHFTITVIKFVDYIYKQCLSSPKVKLGYIFLYITFVLNKFGYL